MTVAPPSLADGDSSSDDGLVKAIDHFLAHPDQSWKPLGIAVAASALLWMLQADRLMSVVRALGDWIFRREAGQYRAARARSNDLRALSRILNARMESLNQRENWSDWRYESLDVQIQVQEWSEGRLAGGRRRRPIATALRSRRGRITLLRGEPGSGKSVALRHLSLLSTKSAQRRFPLRKRVLPIYVNLKSFAPNDPAAPDVPALWAFIGSELNPAKDGSMSRFDEGWLESMANRGRFVFLFDSFDEIPAILGATESDRLVEAYSVCIDEFLNSRQSCRAVVASREYKSPRGVAWRILTVLPMSEQGRHGLIRKSGIDGQAQDRVYSGLPSADLGIYQLAENPLFLSLLCEYVQSIGKFPLNAHDVFRSWVAKRLERDAVEVRNRYQVTPDVLEALTGAIAYAMAVMGSLQVKVEDLQDQLATQRSDEDPPVMELVAVQRVLLALEYVRLGRLLQAGAFQPVMFTFAHRRFQEYFATEYVLDRESAVSGENLLYDARWRETAVVLFQTQSGTRREMLGAFLTEALVSLNHGKAILTWPTKVWHVLGLMQAAVRMDDDSLPYEARIAAKDILYAAMRSDERHLQRWATEVAGALHLDHFNQLLDTAQSLNSPWVTEAARSQLFRAETFMRGQRSYLRRLMLSYASAGILRANQSSIKGKLRAQSNGAPEQKLFSFLVEARRIDGCLAGMVFLGFFFFFPELRQPQVFGFALIIACYWFASFNSTRLEWSLDDPYGNVWHRVLSRRNCLFVVSYSIFSIRPSFAWHLISSDHSILGHKLIQIAWIIFSGFAFVWLPSASKLAVEGDFFPGWRFLASVVLVLRSAKSIWRSVKRGEVWSKFSVTGGLRLWRFPVLFLVFVVLVALAQYSNYEGLETMMNIFVVCILVLGGLYAIRSIYDVTVHALVLAKAGGRLMAAALALQGELDGKNAVDIFKSLKEAPQSVATRTVLNWEQSGYFVTRNERFNHLRDLFRAQGEQVSPELADAWGKLVASTLIKSSAED